MVVLNWKGGLGNVTLSPTAAPLGVPYQNALPSLWPPLPPSNALPGERGIYFLVETDSETGEIKYTNGQPTFIIDSDGFKIPYGYTTYKTDDLINNGTLEDDVVVIGFPPGGDLGDLYSNALNLTTIRLGDGNDSFRIVGNGITQTVKTEVSIEASQGYIFQSNIFAGSGDDYVSVLMPWQSIFRGGTNTNYGPTGLNLQLSDDLSIEEVPYGDTIQLKGSRADWDIEFKDGNGDGSVTLASILNEEDYIATSNNNRIYGFERLLFGDILFDLVLYAQAPSNAIYGQPEYFLFGSETAPELNSSAGAELWQAFRFNRTRIGGIKGATESRITIETGSFDDTPYLVDGIAYASLLTEAGKDILYLGACGNALVDTGADDDILIVANAVTDSTLVGGSGRDSFTIGSASNAQIVLGMDTENETDTVEILGSLSNTVIRGGGGFDTLIIRGTFPDGATNKIVTDSTGTHLQLGTNRFYGFESINISNPPTPTPTTAVSEIRRNVYASEWISSDYDSQNIDGILGPGTSPITIETGDGDNAINVQDQSGTLKNITNAVINTGGGADVVNAAALAGATVNLGPGSDQASFASVRNATVNGGSENDTILLGGPTSLSAATIDGGLGTDTLVVSGLRSSWKLSPESDGLGNLTGIRSSATGLSSSLFTGIEIFQFDDWKTSENPGPGVKLAGIADTIASSIRATEWERLGFDYLTITGITGTSLLPITVETGNAANDIALQDSIAWATIATGSGTDTIKAVGATHTTIYTESDNDNITFSGAFVNSNLNSGTGSDSITLGSASAVTIVAGTAAEADNDSIKVVGDLSNWVTLATGAGDDSISGAGATQTTVYTEAGNDTVVFTGAFVNSNLDSGAGSDWIKLGSASAVTIVAGTDAEADNDSVTVVGDLANTVIRGGGGFDTLRIEGVFAPNTVNRSGVTDGSGTYHQLGSNRFYGFESITIVNPPLSFSTPPAINGGVGGGSSALPQDNIILGGLGRSRTLRGTSGRDIFQYDARRGLTSRDNITNFKAGVDKVLIGGIQRSSPIGKALNGARSGNLLSTVRKSNQVATSRTVLVYNSSNGELFYNPNGSQSGLGSGGGLIADFSSNPRLSNSDFLYSYVDPLA